MEKKQIIKKYEDKENCIKKKCIFAAQNYNQIYKQKQSTIMLNHYETVFIMTPVLSDEQMKETVSKIQGFLTEKGAEVVFEDHWGLRKLAYPIQKKSTGFYHLIEFKAEPSLIAEFELTLKREERVIRFLTVALDKFAIAYNEKKRSDKQPVAVAQEN